MQLSDFQTYILSRLTIPAGDTAATTQATLNLNLALSDLCVEEELKVDTAAVTLTPGTNTANLPADFARPLAISCGAARLLPITWEKWTDLQAATAAGIGPPFQQPTFGLYYVILPGTSPLKLGLWPTPDSSTPSPSLTYVQYPTDLSGATDTPSWLPAQFHILAAEMAISRMAINEEAWLHYVWPQGDIQGMRQQLAIFRRRMRGPIPSRVQLGGSYMRVSDPWTAVRRGFGP